MQSPPPSSLRGVVAQTAKTNAETDHKTRRQRRENTGQVSANIGQASLSSAITDNPTRALHKPVPAPDNANLATALTVVKPKPKLFTLGDDVFLEIIRQLFAGTLTINLNSPTSCAQATTLLQVSHPIRAATLRIIYPHCTFLAGIEILCRLESLEGHTAPYVPHSTLRPETICLVRRLTIPGRLVHAFSRPEFDEESNARFFEGLKVLVVEFDAGEWDARMDVLSTDWTAKGLVENKVYMMFVAKPNLIEWLYSIKEYDATLRLRFPVRDGVYHGACITNKGIEIDEQENMPEPLRTVATLWKDALSAVSKHG